MRIAILSVISTLAWTIPSQAEAQAVESEAARAALVGMSVADLDRSIAFYTDMFGFKLVERNKYPAGRLELAFLELAGFRLELVALQGAVARSLPDPGNDASLLGIAKIGFAVPDPVALTSRLRAGGARILIAATPEAPRALLRDPDGNLVGLTKLPQ